MSTRSGKRIHSSFQENTIKTDPETVLRSERKTRSKRLDGNIEEVAVRTVKSKKRNNYVSYPTEDDPHVQEVALDVNSVKPSRVLRKNALKEQNIAVDNTEELQVVHEPKILRRKSRRAKKLGEDGPEDVREPENIENMSEAMEKPKTKSKKKKGIISESIEPMPSKKSLKKKKRRSRQSNHVVVEDIAQDDCTLKNNTFNKSMSIDSFHSAAGSPKHLSDFEVKTDLIHTTFELDNDLEDTENIPLNRSSKSSRKNSVTTHETSLSQTLKNNANNIYSNNSFVQGICEGTSSRNSKRNSKKACIKESPNDNKMLSITLTNDVNELHINNTFDEGLLRKKSKTKDTTFDKSDASLLTSTKHNDSIVETDAFSSEVCNNGAKKRKSNINDGTFDISERIIDTTFEKSLSDKKDSTYDKSTNKILDTTSEKNISYLSDVLSKKTSGVNNSTFDKIEKVDDTTFEKDTVSTPRSAKKVVAKRYSLRNSTNTSNTPDVLTNSAKNRKSFKLDDHDESVPKMNSTFDKIEEKKGVVQRNFKLSLEDQVTNLDSTFDKADITKRNESSKSSLLSSDNSEIVDKSNISRISITSDDSLENIVNTTPVLIESSMDDSRVSKHESPAVPQTPLKREGTFTKESPEMIHAVETPTKLKSTPTAGCTPYHVNKSSQKKMVLNVTRSIEKGQGSLDPGPRVTKVMFCSPVDNPALVLQEKRKVIKSNLKGSNKSFVFEETASPRPAGRKRSYTQSDLEEARVKRKRLADELQHSVNRLSRPRTSSATAKLTEPTTPTKKAPTPSKEKTESKLSRTKLPNFAALHQRRFARMESLDECQERRAKRARQLLTPTGAVTVLERSSPRGTSEPPNPKDPPHKPPTTLEPPRPGFTRFGFKLNLDVNPFSIPTKQPEKPKEQNLTTLTRQKTLPSLAGTTSARREVAKQAVMREKSFTDKRIVNRSETRTIIKGVRLNRRFELQMKLRNLE